MVQISQSWFPSPHYVAFSQRRLVNSAISHKTLFPFLPDFQSAKMTGEKEPFKVIVSLQTFYWVISTQIL